MRRLLIFLVLALLSASASAQLERGVKGDVEDVVLLGADDWHAVVAATPMAIWSEGNSTITKPMLILPREVRAGERIGWIEQSDLDRYGVLPVLHTLEPANVTSIIIHGSGDLVKSAVKSAQKEGLKAYVTAGLEPEAPSSQSKSISSETLSSESQLTLKFRDESLEEIGLANVSLDQSSDDTDMLQRLSPANEGEGSLNCPVNPDSREALYNHVEKIIEDYKADGVVLYKFGFEDENYCFCDYCKEEFYRDTGIDLTKIYTSSYNTERWKQWKEEQTLKITKEVSNITKDLGPVSLGVAIGNPFDRSNGYNYADISDVADFAVISPIQPADVKLAAGMTAKPVYVRLSKDYVGYTLSAQNVEGAVKYMEDLVSSGASGLAFEYDVVYTPLWSELEPPSKAAKWLLNQLGGEMVGIGNVSWKVDSRIEAKSHSELAGKISERWLTSPGAVIVGDNYSAGLTAATIGSYLNWPILFVDGTLPEETRAAIERLNASTIVIVGPVSSQARSNLAGMNLTLIDGDGALLQKEMALRGENITGIVLTNSKDLSLLQPKPKKEIDRGRIGEVMVSLEVAPSQIPAERSGEVIRMNVTLENIDTKDVEDIVMVDRFPNGLLLRWPKATQGEANVTNPLTLGESTPINAFLDGSLLMWEIDKLEPGKTASLTLEINVMYALDAGWVKQIDRGLTLSYAGLTQNLTVKEEDKWPITNITYPGLMPVGMATISWNVEGTPTSTGLTIFTPDGRVGKVSIEETAPGKRYSERIPFTTPGTWRFKIDAKDSQGYSTENYTIEVKSNFSPMNMTAFSHTKVPRTSLVAAQAAAARKALLVDVAKDPQDVNPAEVEGDLLEKVKEMGLEPEYLTIVGDPGSMPFIPTGQNQYPTSIIKYDIYRDYQIQMDDDNSSDVASGRILGLSVYDASQLLARTLAYDRIQGSWKKNALVISSPPLQFPHSAIPMRVVDYLSEAGMNVRDLRDEEATYQLVSSQMNNGQNLVFFLHHGLEDVWGLSDWPIIDGQLDEASVKQLTLAPQTTTTMSCLTSRLKGYTINISGTEMYSPMRLDDSIALAFIRAGAVNYVGSDNSATVFFSEDYLKRLYQALVYENATIGQAMSRADDLYRMKIEATEKILPYDELDEEAPWAMTDTVYTTLNDTVSEYNLIGDPSFRPAIPRVPELPYVVNVSHLSVPDTPEAIDAKAVVSVNDTSANSTLGNSSLTKETLSNSTLANITLANSTQGDSVLSNNVTSRNVSALNRSVLNRTLSYTNLDNSSTNYSAINNSSTNYNAINNITINSTALGNQTSTEVTTSSEIETINDTGEVEVSLTPMSELATDWLYWIQTETQDGKLSLNAPPALIGEVIVPRDAEEIVVKENEQSVWHSEIIEGKEKRVTWPVVRPRLNETRTFSIHYRIIPTLTQVINVGSGWNLVSIYLKPRDNNLANYFKEKPYRGIFTITSSSWDMTIKDSELKNVTFLDPGKGYVLDSPENFTVEIRGKPVELPYRVKLEMGWNLVGVPYDRTVKISSITVNANHKRYSYPEAVEKGIISAFFWSYSGSDRSGEIKWDYLGQNDTIKPGKAYMVEAKSECRLEFK